jgi:hypothetical protein
VKVEAITEIGIDHLDRIYVKPEETKFRFIYRAAAEVHWDEELSRLHSPVPREWTHLDWYRHIVAIAKDEYGISLVISDATKWDGASDELRQQIKSLT